MGQKSIHELAIHERMEFEKGDSEIMRVAGGWIYEFWVDGSAVDWVFVPCSDEFKDPAPCPAQRMLNMPVDELSGTFNLQDDAEVNLVRALWRGRQHERR